MSVGQFFLLFAKRVAPVTIQGVFAKTHRMP